MVTIRLHNSKTRTKEAFVPLDPENVRMYVCGPTVYDRAHLGNGRPVVVFDTLYRLLRHVYARIMSPTPAISPTSMTRSTPPQRRASRRGIRARWRR